MGLIKQIANLLYCCLLCGFCFVHQSNAQSSLKKSRILFLVDASSSMSIAWNETNNRFDVATNLILQIVDSIYLMNNEVEFAVRAYGTKFPSQEKNCYDTELEVPFNIQNAAQIKWRMKNIKPIGFSPIAYSLRQASFNELNQSNLYDYSIIFITDGGESCGGDVCAAYRDFILNKIKVKPYVIGLDKNAQLKSVYECMGKYVEVTEVSDIPKAVSIIVDENRPLLEKPKQLNITTQLSNPEPIKETLKKSDKHDSVPLPKPSKNIFPLLRIASYPIVKSNGVIINGSYIIVKKNQTVQLAFDLDQPKPTIQEPNKIVIAKNKQPLALLKNVKLKISPTSKTKIIGNYYSSPEDAKAILKFEVDAPTKPVAPRDMVIIPRIKPNLLPLKSLEKKTQLKNVVLKNYKKEKITIAFEIESPRQNIILPKMKMASKNLPNPSKLNLLGKSFAYKPKEVKIKFDIETRPHEVLSKIISTPFPMRYSYAFRLPSSKPIKLAKQTAKINFEVEAPKKKDTIKAIIPTGKTLMNEHEYSVETIASEETKIQVYFVGPNKKSYLKAKPEIEVYDATTKALVASFKREMSGNEPIPQLIKPGKYNIVVKGQSDLVSSNVTIEANKINKVSIRVTDGTLAFAYMGNLKRPVEFNAIVNRRFASGATILQKCSDRLNYEPGTYYVEINTMPASKFSIDLTFGAVYEIQIPEPGTLQITNQNSYGKIQLQSVLGDQYLTFKSLDISGQLDEQRLILQPGPYKAIVPVNPKIPQAGTKVIDFRVKSNQVTELIIE